MFPRAPTAIELELIGKLLPVDAFPDVDTYQRQAEHLQVTGECECGCPTIYLEVDVTQASPAEFRTTPLPVEGRAGDEEPGIELLLFQREGLLSSLELVYYATKPPSAWPDASAVSTISINRTYRRNQRRWSTRESAAAIVGRALRQGYATQAEQ